MITKVLASLSLALVISLSQCTGVCWEVALEPIELPFTLNGVCSPSEANYCSNPFEIFLDVIGIFVNSTQWKTGVEVIFGRISHHPFGPAPRFSTTELSVLLCVVCSREFATLRISRRKQQFCQKWGTKNNRNPFHTHAMDEDIKGWVVSILYLVSDRYL